MKVHDPGIRIYLREIGRIPLLTPSQEIQLARCIRRGDQKARKQMIEANLRLVVKIACEYENLGLPLLDLISEGNIGLVRAVNKYDPSRGVKFSTHAAWWIKQGIKRALTNQSRTVRLPNHVIVKISKIRKVHKEIAQKKGRDPSAEEVAGMLDIPVAMVSNLQNLARIPFSLNAPVNAGSDIMWGDMISDQNTSSAIDGIDHHQMHETVQRLLNRLDRRARIILMLRYGLRGMQSQTLDVIGKRLNISKERVRQIQNDTTEKLKTLMEAYV
jgi:RNA polymerase primary sigma factor